MKKIPYRFFLGFFILSLMISGGVSYYASSHPDGLEKVAEDKGFLGTAQDSAVSGSPLADYGIAGLENARLSVGVSGIIGVLVTAFVAFGAFFLIRRLKKGSN